MSINWTGCRGYNMITRSLGVTRTIPSVTTDFIRAASSAARFKKWYRSLFASKVYKPPYKHICQVGDPVLRQPAEKVPLEEINSLGIQQIISILKEVKRDYGSFSLSAPQIGVPLQIFVIGMDMKAVSKYSEELRNLLKIKEIPLRVVINPKMKVIDYSQEKLVEVCDSVRGFSADVDRYAAVKISGWNEEGKEQSWEADGQEARIIQHEIDHLGGILFTDRMEATTFSCSAWETVNNNKGNIYMAYWPKERRKRFF